MSKKKLVVLVLAFSFLCTLFISPQANAALSGAAAPKRAVYILPGFMESRLFSKKIPGMEIWLGAGLISDIGLDALGRQPELANNANGAGMSAYADRKRDNTGTLASMLPLISSIKTSLAANRLSDTYTVEFFSYNWLADLNDTARELAADIKAKNYESVILITHSNGGLLASAFIAQSPAHQAMVEKAILLAPALWGTYTALEPVETGGITAFDGSPLMGLVEIGYDVFVRPVTKHWVKTWSRNSPNIYQLMAGNEYISMVPILYRTATGTQAITEPDEYYALLNKSPNTNSNLVDGNARSLKYLRETVYENDVLKLWEDMDVTLIACEYGFLTPISAVYRQSGNTAIYEGAIYSKAGDGIVAGISLNGNGRLKYVNLSGVSHVPILFDSRALRTVNDIILGRPVTASTDASSAIQTSSILPTVGMSDMIRVELKSSDPLSATALNKGVGVKIYDSKGKVVAQASGEAQRGFAGNNFVYTSWETKENATNILCYIPKNGYSMEVFAGNINRRASNITVITETLDSSGAILSRSEYKLSGANLLTGAVFKLNGSQSMTPVANSGATLKLISTETYAQNWQFASAAMTLKMGESETPSLTGPDAAKMVMGNYNWTSADEAIATVSASGQITGIEAGTTVITATAKDGSLKIEFIRVTVTEYQ